MNLLYTVCHVSFSIHRGPIQMVCLFVCSKYKEMYGNGSMGVLMSKTYIK